MNDETTSTAVEPVHTHLSLAAKGGLEWICGDWRERKAAITAPLDPIS